MPLGGKKQLSIYMVNLKFNFFMVLLAGLLSGSKSTMGVEGCVIQEETFTNSNMRKFLETSVSYRDVTEMFNADSSRFTILMISDDKTGYGRSDDGSNWEVFSDSSARKVQSDDLKPVISRYCDLEIAFRVVCPENHVVFGRTQFQFVWIKERGKIEFAYFAPKCGIECLGGNDATRILPLLKSVEVLWNGK